MFLLFTIKIPTSMDYRVTGNTQNEKQSQRASKSNKVASVKELTLNTLRTGLLNCLNARSRGLTFRHRASCI